MHDIFSNSYTITLAHEGSTSLNTDA